MAGPNIQNFGNISAGTITNATWNGSAIGAAYGGSGQSSYTTGALLYASSSSALSQLSPTTNGYVLTLSGGLPVWAAASGGSAITSLTGDVTATGPGAAPASLVATSNATLTTLSALTTASSLSSVGTITSGTWNGTTITVPNGGTGVASFTAYAPIAGGLTSTGNLQSLDSGISNSGYVLTSNGSSAAPTWQATGTSGANTALSNLSAVAINTDLLPSSGGSINLGSSTDYWNKIYVSTIASQANSGDTVIDVSNSNLKDKAGNTQLNWSTSGLLIGGEGSNSGILSLANATNSFLASIQALSTSVSYNFNLPATAGTSGQVLASAGGGSSPMTWVSAATGSVTSVSVVSANGFAGTVATSTTTPAITISTTINSPVLAGNGTAISAATTTGSGSTVVLADAPTFAGAVNMASYQINDLGSPSSSTDAATKGYVDSAISGLTWQGPAQAYANSNVPLTGGATLTIDGYPVQNGNLVLLSNQTTASQNGEYSVSGIGTAYVLTPNGLPTSVGDAWLITNGTVFANSAFTATAVVPAATFIEFAGPTSYIFNAPLGLSGNTVSITEATTSTNGYLSSTDWNIFNNKQSAGNYITALTGDATASGPGSSALTLATVNSSPGTYAISTVTVNGKGLVTSAAAATTTGSGSVVLATNPMLTTPNIGAATATSISSTGALTIDANSGTSAVQIEALNVQRSTDGTNFITENYVDSTTLTDNTTAAVTAFQFAVASFAGEEITYVIESGDANADRRIGTIRVTANGSGTITPSLTDTYAESADCGVSWTATNSGGTISVNYTTTNQGAARTMRADCKFFRA